MEKMKNINHCPICSDSKFTPFIECVDYTVSKKKFTIVKCEACDFHFTNPIPVAKEIGEYYKSESYISHSSSSKGLINKIYHKVRTYTLKQKVKLIQSKTNGLDHLDIGAGTGHFINATTQAGFNTLGLEPDKDARQLANSTFKVNIQPLDELHKLEDNSRDVITLWHVLEHVYDLQKDVTKMTSILKEDGVMIVAVPNRNSYDAKKYKEFWAAYDLPIHLYHFVPNDIRNLFGQFNMEVKEVLPMKFDSYYVSMLSEKYKGGNIVSAFVTGLKSNMKADDESYSSQIYILKKKAI
jgi:2-polyprenyl-3-methyl-5-hydroxy-6-metoxy-1,4-benzoquinol methylase